MARKWLHQLLFGVEADDVTPTFEKDLNDTAASLAALLAAQKVPTLATPFTITLAGHVQRVGMDPQVTGDDSNQLRGWDMVLGLSDANTDDGTLYPEIEEGAADHLLVTFYMGAGTGPGARTDAVAHTAEIENGEEAILALVEDNASGVSGFIDFYNWVEADSIVVAFTLTRPCQATVLCAKSDNDDPVVIGLSPTTVLADRAAGDTLVVRFADATALHVNGTAGDVVYATVLG
jgi:hypothetical protein